jgi:sulfate adenylyltransferase subunit 2
MDEYAQRMLAFNAWANQELVEFLATLPPETLELRYAGSYGSIIETLAHMAISECRYLEYLQARPPSPRPLADASITQIRQLIAQNREQAERVAGELPEPSLRLLLPDGYRSAGTVILQLAMHGAEHRTQIDSMLGRRASMCRRAAHGPTASCTGATTGRKAGDVRTPERLLASRARFADHSYAMTTLTHLQRLEAESIHIMREVVAEAENPVMLYSVGKDSGVMVHLARKAFFPSKPPFPMLHVDTTWKFRDMYEMRGRMAQESGMELLVHINPEAQRLGINPFDHGSAVHTDIWKTQGLIQALDKYKFDVAFGGGRRDEEKSRAKERIFSFRTAQHRWDPKNQRPELWHLYNVRKHPGESIRVFPLSNWTELDIWQYTHLENIPVVPLYLAKERPVVERDGMLLMVDDDRMAQRLAPGEVPQMKKVRFRTLGCYPLTGAIESEAETLTGVIQEMLLATTSERQGRLIDHDSSGSMEKKKQEGYF